MAQGAILNVTAFDRDQRRQLATGRVQVIDNQIDTTTGTVKLRAVFDNADETLFANQFVTVDLLIDTLKQVPVVSSAATQTGAPGTFVYVIKDDGTVAMRPVKLGQRDGDLVQVLDGLQFGDKVVTDGLDRLKEGARVILREEKPAVAPGDTAPSGSAQSERPPGDRPPGDKPKGDRPRRDREGPRDAAPSRP
jgi:multidrug efflux system membrane fusion protein